MFQQDTARIANWPVRGAGTDPGIRRAVLIGRCPARNLPLINKIRTARRPPICYARRSCALGLRDYFLKSSTRHGHVPPHSEEIFPSELEADRCSSTTTTAFFFARTATQSSQDCLRHNPRMRTLFASLKKRFHHLHGMGKAALPRTPVPFWLWEKSSPSRITGESARLVFAFPDRVFYFASPSLPFVICRGSSKQVLPLIVSSLTYQ